MRILKALWPVNTNSLWLSLAIIASPFIINSLRARIKESYKVRANDSAATKADSFAIASEKISFTKEEEKIKTSAYERLNLSEEQKSDVDSLIKLIKMAHPNSKLSLQEGQESDEALINYLYPYCDRQGRETYDMQKKNWTMKFTNEQKDEFIRKVTKPIITPKQENPISIIIPAGSILAREKRQAIAKSLEDHPIRQIITVSGERGLWKIEVLIAALKGSLLWPSQQNEEYYWQANKKEFGEKMNAQQEQLVYLFSPIHDNLYSKKQSRATTFDNAAVLGQFLKQQKDSGILGENEVIVIAIEQPSAKRMHAIFKKILAVYIPNRVELHTGNIAYHERSHLAERILGGNNLLEKTANQVYMHAVSARMINRNIIPNLGM